MRAIYHVLLSCYTETLHKITQKIKQNYKKGKIVFYFLSKFPGLYVFCLKYRSDLKGRKISRKYYSIYCTAITVYGKLIL